ncbi:MAG: glycosyltransferase family 4 protein, partial [Acidobacteriota bacterium]
MRLLFMKHALVWPRSSGHDVHTYYMMKACAELGHEVGLATAGDADPAAIAGLPLSARFALDQTPPTTDPPLVAATSLQRKFQSYWGVPQRRVAALRTAAREMAADAVIVVGLDALSYLPELGGVARVWYAADEWTLHHLSQVRAGSAALKDDLRAAVVKGLYERVHRGVVDRAWVVSERDRRAMRWVAGIANVDVLPNGVDGAYFAPGPEAVEPNTAVFWGRLDFGPNIQALQWFCVNVWPKVRQQVPTGRFTIIGFQPTPEIRALAKIDGITLAADLPDLRTSARRHAVTVLPFVSGAGIKNKLLEAAAMGMAILCTPKTATALRGTPPIVSASTPDQFAAALVALWKDDSRRRDIGRAARAWVLEHHTWSSVAQEAMAGLTK